MRLPASQTQFTQEGFLFPERMCQNCLSFVRGIRRESLGSGSVKGMLLHFLKELSVRLNYFFFLITLKDQEQKEGSSRELNPDLNREKERIHNSC